MTIKELVKLIETNAHNLIKESIVEHDDFVEFSVQEFGVHDIKVYLYDGGVFEVDEYDDSAGMHYTYEEYAMFLDGFEEDDLGVFMTNPFI